MQSSIRHPASAREKKRCGLLIYDDQLREIDRILDRLTQHGTPYTRAALVRRAIDDFLAAPHPLPTAPIRDGLRASVTTGIDLFADQIGRLDDHITNDDSQDSRQSRTAVVRHALDLFLSLDRKTPFDPISKNR